MVGPRHHEYYRERSHHFISLVNDMLGRGEPELACEVLWGAAAHAIKSIAQHKGWAHGTHSLLLASIERLITEHGAPSQLRGQYHVTSEFHVGFYGDRVFEVDNIRMGEMLVVEFIQTLEILD